MKKNIFAPTELQIQSAFFDIVRAHEPRYHELKFLFAAPNGGLRNVVVAMQMKKSGTRKGVLDVWFPCRRGDYVGMAFEFKVPGKKMSPAQLEYATYLTGQGWYCGTWFDAEAAWADVKQYLALSAESAA